MSESRCDCGTRFHNLGGCELLVFGNEHPKIRLLLHNHPTSEKKLVSFSDTLRQISYKYSIVLAKPSPIDEKGFFGDWLRRSKQIRQLRFLLPRGYPENFGQPPNNQECWNSTKLRALSTILIRFNNKRALGAQSV